jgi:tRNA G46 methylase TrmB
VIQVSDIKDEFAAVPDRRAGWTPPANRETTTADGGVRGAMGGSRLYDQPRHAATRDAVLDFVAGRTPGAPQGPVAVEVGFDHGMVLLDQARAHPEQRWLGIEVRGARVEALKPHCPPNCMVLQADARTLFAAVLPASSLDRVDVLFPTPWWDDAHRDKRLLFTPAFVGDLARVVRPTGVVRVATDVGPYFEHLAGLFAGWVSAPEPPPVATLSRRERVCRRDGLPVWRGCWSPPA